MCIELKKINFKKNALLFSCLSDKNFSDSNCDFFQFIFELNEMLENSALIKNSRSVKAGIVNYKTKKYFIKRYNDRGFLHRLKYLVRDTRAFNAIKIYAHLKSSGCEIKLPHHYCAIKSRKYFFDKTFSFSIQEFIELRIPLEELISKCRLSTYEYNRFINNTVFTISTMHKANTFHGDAKLTNFFFQKNNDNNDYSCGLWDLDVARVKIHFPKELRERDLARLIASFSELLNKEGKIEADEIIINAFMQEYSKQTNIELNKNRLKKIVSEFKR